MIVAYAFPPENVSGAARPYRFYRYLPEHGITPVIVTATPQPQDRPDIVFVRDDAGDATSQSWSWQLERVVRKTILPGEVGLTWSLKAATACAALVPPGGRTVILSTSPPFSSHLAARRVAGIAGIPWIADFRDPMFIGDDGVLRILSRIESRLVQAAHAVIANTDRAAEELRRRYPHAGDKLNVIWNGFDPAEKIRAALLPERGFRQIVHVGEIYGGRHPGPILASVRRLLAAGVIGRDSLRLSLIGPSVESEIPEIAVLRELVANGTIQYVPHRVPQEEARRVACQADGLLLLQPQTDTQVPAKLFEYIRIGRPVLAYVRRNSPSERILALSGIRHRAVYTDDGPKEVDAKLLEFLALPTDPVPPSAEFEEQFDARHHARSLASIVRRLLSSPETR